MDDIKCSTADEMDVADEELRETIKIIWPIQAKNMVDLLVPPPDQLNTGKMTVGKIYASYLILESWRTTKFGQLESAGGNQVNHTSILTSSRSHFEIY